nr:hypothetical protein [Tanacetum cinerariifolium]
MVAYLSKSDASVGFDQIVDFLNAQVIQYALMVNPTIYVSCIKQFWASATIKKVENSTFLSTFLTAWLGTWIALASFSSEVEEDDVEVPDAPTSLSPTIEPTPPPQDSITTPPQAQPATPSSLPQEQPTDTSESSMSILNTLMETWRKDDDNAATKDVSAAEPTMFDDEEVTMTMAQTLIKMKAKKARLLGEQMAKRLHDEEVKQAAAKEKQEKYDLERAKVLQQQYVDKQENIDWNDVAEQMQEKHLDNIRKYQSLKRKPISIAQARKNMILYLKNMDGYKMEHFRDEEPTKKRVAEETLLQESFKKLKAVEVSGSESTQETPTNDPKEISEEDVQNMLEIVLLFKFKVEALQDKYPIIDWEIHSEGSRSYWKIIRVGGIT